MRLVLVLLGMLSLAAAAPQPPAKAKRKAIVFEEIEITGQGPIGPIIVTRSQFVREDLEAAADHMAQALERTTRR